MTLIQMILAAIAAVVIVVFLVWRRRHRRVTIYEWQWGLLYRNGRFQRLLEPGVHHFFVPMHYWMTLDRRVESLVVSGQEVLTKDGLGIKLSVVLEYRILDPRLLIQEVPLNDVTNLELYLHPLVQVPLRAAVAGSSMDDLISNRDSIAEGTKSAVVSRVEKIGVEVISVAIRDIMLGREIREAYAAQVLAQKRAQASLEQARGEIAALRALGNAARMVRDNPELMKLRILQAMQSSDGRKHTFVVDLAERRLGQAIAGTTGEGDASS